ncbi:hypothetical protein [Pseudomonas tremae]|uniref:hypothetical protein n=1 Tax=Pseudomonas tremae TaxID=200454 RepID=UPI0004291D75|nr:hypothetical protein [Pseudomonas tremae]
MDQITVNPRQLVAGNSTWTLAHQRLSQMLIARAERFTALAPIMRLDPIVAGSEPLQVSPST